MRNHDELIPKKQDGKRVKMVEIALDDDKACSSFGQYCFFIKDIS